MKELLHALITNVDEWKSILEAAGNMIESAMFIINNDGLTIRGIDEFHMALLDITIPNSAFQKYYGYSSFIALTVEQLRVVIETAQSSDIIEFIVNDNLQLKIHINGQLKMTFNLGLLDRSEINIPIPKTNYNSKILIPSQLITRILSNVQAISEAVTINSMSNRVEFLGKSDTGNIKIELDEFSDELKFIEFTENSVSTYPINYLMKVIRSLGRTSDSMTFEYATNSPIHVEFIMPSMIKVEYYLAPRNQD